MVSLYKVQNICEFDLSYGLVIIIVFTPTTRM